MNLWVLSSEISDGAAAIKSRKKGLVSPPVRGWQYWSGTWKDDDTLTVAGKHYQLSDIIFF